LTTIVIPVINEAGIGSSLSAHFGRAPFFAVFELDENDQVRLTKTLPNRSEHFGGLGSPLDVILQANPDAVIAHGMGPRALSQFQDAKVAVLKANSSSVRTVLELYVKDELEELTEGCHQARHKI
jgi:predicted Fe-Mo cluster-binding NifX family protein